MCLKMSKDKYYECLICAFVIPPDKIKQVDKFEGLFLLRVLLEISNEDQLVENIRKVLTFVQICDQCNREVKQCKEIYGEICEKIERFWEFQNKVLEKFSQHTRISGRTNKDKDDDWILKCRHFVKNRKLI